MTNEFEITAIPPARRRRCGCPKLLPGPWAVSIIVLNELCERFAFYASRAILVLYLNEGLGYSEDTSISLYSYFMAACYFSPLLGGYIADVVLGKFKTIVAFNIVYLFGLTTLTVSAFFENAPGSFIGLLLIALGTGGIKPCIAPFGAEQLADCTEAEKTSFFFLFYLSINVGSTFSYILTPIIRENAGFAPAFSLALGVFFISFLIFLRGNSQYIKLPPSGSSAYAKLWRVLRAALFNKGSSTVSEQENAPLMRENSVAVPVDTVKEHAASANAASAPPGLRWLYRAVHLVAPDDLYGAATVLNVLPLLFTLPVFWAIFDSQGSIWTIQRKHMDNCMFGADGTCFTPEQLGALNPMCIVLLVPLFEQCILPWLRRRKAAWCQPTALRRMSVGMQIACVAFVLTWLVQNTIDNAPDQSVTSWLQVPQVFVISFAEVLVSATGLEWAYSQSPVNMRGTIVAFYHAMVAVGNILTGVIFNALASTLSQAHIILLLAGLMSLAGIVFAVLAYRYKPVPFPTVQRLHELADVSEGLSTKPQSS